MGKQMNIKKGNAIFWVIGITLVALFCNFILDGNRLNKIQALEAGEYDYCIEWGDGVDRHRLDYQCSVLFEPPLQCGYNINENNELEVTIYNLSADITNRVIYNEYLNCTRYVKSIGG